MEHQGKYTKTLLDMIESGETTLNDLQSLKEYTAGFVGQDAPEHNTTYISILEVSHILSTDTPSSR
jgi:hypothetical protein